MGVDIISFQPGTILYAANLNESFANAVNITGDTMTGPLVISTPGTALTGGNGTFNQTLNVGNQLFINNIEIGTGLQNAYNAANAAFIQANAGGNPAIVNSINAAFLRANANVQNQLTFTTSGGLTVNSGLSLTITGNNTVVLAANVATGSQVGMVQLTDSTTTTATTTAATANAVNTAMTFAQGAFRAANSYQAYMNAAFTQANNSTGGAAYATANAAFIQANAAFVEANSFQSVINTSYATANVSFSAYAEANSFQSVINSAHATANVSFSAYAEANSFQSVINSAHATANVSFSAYAEANSFQSVINTAFTTANNALPKSGGTITGSLTVNGTINSNTISLNHLIVGGKYTLSMTDSGTTIFYDNTAPLTINTASNLSVGFRVIVYQVNTGSVTVQAGPGTFLSARINGTNSIAAQNASISLVSWIANTFLMDGAII